MAVRSLPKMLPDGGARFYFYFTGSEEDIMAPRPGSLRRFLLSSIRFTRYSAENVSPRLTNRCNLNPPCYTKKSS